MVAIVRPTATMDIKLKCDIVNLSNQYLENFILQQIISENRDTIEPHN